MAAITTSGGGNWSSTTPNAPWPSGTVPGSGDTVTIANTHTVTIDTAAACSTLTINAGGILSHSNSTNNSITAQTTITNNGTWNCDLSSTASVTATISGNNSAAASDNCITLGAFCAVTWKGYPRKRKTRLNGAIIAGATSATVDDATGWQVGDIIVFATTQAYNATPRTDLVTLTSVSGNSIGWTGGVTYDHADNGYVGNFSSNVIVGPPTGSETRRHNVYWGQGYSNGTTAAKLIDNVQFYAGAPNNYNKYGQLSFGDGSATITLTGYYNWIVSNSAFYDFRTHGCFAFTAVLPIYLNTDVFYSANQIGAPAPSGSRGFAVISETNTRNCFNLDDCGVFRVTGAATSSGIGFYPNHAGVLKNTFVSACANTGVQLYAVSPTIENLEVIANQIGYRHGINSLVINNSDLGVAFGATNGTSEVYESTIVDVTYANSDTQTLSSTGLPALVDNAVVKYANKNSDVTSQEIYRPFCEIKRNNSTFNRSTSSISIKPTRVATDSQREQEILCANGATIRVIGYVQADANFYNSGTWTAPTVTLSGLGAATQTLTATAACNGAWEQFDLSITNNSGNDGNFTLTYTANANAVTTGTVYFDGVPDAPFVTKCRHYGFLIAESSPTRTVDPYTVASESTAAAYTGVTINNTTKEISFAAGTADTAQKFYDFHQATICDNLGYDVAISRAGTLYSLLSTWTVVDPYYSGTLTWSGGTIQYSTTGTKSDDLDGCIVEFGAAGGGTYTLDGTLSGTLDLRNLDAAAITVEVPTGTTTTTANNTGGAITVQTPQVYQSVVLTGGVAGSRVQLYDNTSSTELYNDVPGSWPFTWTDPDPYSADREIRLRVAYTDGADARQFIDQTIGTVTEADPELTYLVAQIDDAIYNANAIDGSALTGYAIVGSNLTIDVSDGTATWAEMYAYQVYWLSTEDGIRDQDLYIQAVDTANYIFYGGFQIKNTSAPSVPLLVTGGNGEPSSGPATDLLDTTGGTIFCNSAIVVPYSSGADVTEQIVRDGLTSQGYTTTRANAIDTIPEDVWGHTLP